LRRYFAAFGALGAILLVAGESSAAGGEAFGDVVFTDYSEKSSSAELVRRMLSPLAALELKRQMGRTGKQMVEQSIKLSEEKFVVYVPAPRPARGYALLVFVPPWQDARLPSGWTAVLDRYGVIFVSAARSGNDESVFDRREPLALLAAHNAMQRYPVDAERVYIGGFSGGSRVALRLAVGYPDVFRGAILNAGSDPIGDSHIPIPPKDLFLQFQSTRLVYVTGEQDTSRLSDDSTSMHSMKKWCVFDVQSHVVRSGSHEVADSTALAWALSVLVHDVRPDPNKLGACRIAIEQELNTKMQELDSLVAAGHDDEAQKLLLKLDGRFGGLASPRSIELAR